ncbi:Rpn family recombination-promoting nuclease/putative transposase [Leptospira borgpetersenii]|uniref:Rpn family recombination-promoting nuclease/putative transposase n=1 Tax=Leptospira borgpetersenii TaxID=174 RepID=UPI0027DB5D33|nr:Rpn family recombination-promoting nuclease/putative transposase [Leptospira borgpetersenii]MCH1896811.1 Rpn family recombination-promoting nuclease/putative transposase [Leptospira borgpetersenii]
MTEVNNPHDRLIRETFQDKKEAATFFKNTLPPEVVELLDLENLELTESSFVSEELKQEQTDLLFQIPLKSGNKSNVYLLFEHKSYLENTIYIQLLGYLTEIYRNQQRSGESFSVVIPFVFYHGEKEWKLGDRFEEESKRVAILRKLLLYIYWARDLKPTELKRVLAISKLEQYEELTMTTAERLISEGIQQGKIEGKIETARNMLSEDIQLEAVLRITGLSKQDLKDHGVI